MAEKVKKNDNTENIDKEWVYQYKENKREKKDIAYYHGHIMIY